MRPLLLLALLAFIALPTMGQDVFEFEIIDREKFTAIEEAYTAAIDSRPDVKCVFPGQEELVTKNWQTLQKSFREYLSAQQARLPTGTRFFIRYYFDKGGAVQHVGFKIHTPLRDEEKAAFEKHLKDFAQQSNFGMTGAIAYTQCGTVKF